MLTVGKAATDRQPINFRKPEAARFERVDGRSEVAYSRRVDDMTTIRQIVQRRTRRGVSTFGIPIEFTRCEIEVGN
jgi:hypothetical protein